MFKAILARYAVSAVLGLITVSVISAIAVSLIRYGGNLQFTKATEQWEGWERDKRRAKSEMDAQTVRENAAYRRAQREAQALYPNLPELSP
jgi:hypothetical protein